MTTRAVRAIALSLLVGAGMLAPAAHATNGYFAHGQGTVSKGMAGAGVDMTQLFVAPTWTWRAGVSYAKQPIPDSEVLFNILAPGVQEWHFTGGFSRELGPRVMLSGMALDSPEKTVSGPNPLGPGQSIELRMYQLGASLSLGWRF
jgi:hypothetical protein